MNIAIIQKKIILASGSPRRKQLLESLGFDFIIKTKNTDETFPASMPQAEVPVYLAEKKAVALLPEINDEIIISADTVVVINEIILNKPTDETAAFEMLQLLSGKMHKVITGVCLLSTDKKILFSDITEVYFKNLLAEEINFYIKNFKPFDKAGSYGAQEWMGMIAMEKLVGSYFNVMGLPVHRVYEELIKF